MSDLESRYRRALRWYPKEWRAAHEDAMVGTLLDVAEDDKRTRPARGELADLRASALASRLGPLGRIPAHVRDRATALAFGLGAGIAVTALIATAVQAKTTTPSLLRLEPVVGPFIGYSFLFYGMWILAFVAAIIGRKWAARSLAIASILVAVALRFAAGDLLFVAPTTTTIVFVGILALMSFIGDPFATRRGRARIAVSTLSWASFMGLTLWYQSVTQGGQAGRTDWFIGPLWLWLYWVVPFALILALVLMRLLHSGWGGAIIILLVPIVPFVVFGWSPSAEDVINRGALLALAIAIICVVYCIPRVFGLRIRITRS
jgi:hypothetical protein